VRYDQTNDFGGKATWQSGLLWQATETLSVSGSYGVSYRAPHLTEIGGNRNVFGSNTNLGFTDPFRGNQPVVSNYVSGANPNLKAETGNSRTLGIVYSCPTLPGLRASLTYYAVNISNYISIPQGQAVIDNPNLFPGAIVRAPATPQDQAQGFLGPITAINDLYFNFGDLRVAGVDADLSYALDTRAGRFTPSAALAEIHKWQSALTPGSPSISYVSKANDSGPGWAPRWKGTAALGWSRAALSANFAGRYIGRYKDYQDLAPNSNELGNAWIFDFNMRYDAGKALAGNNQWLAGMYLAAGVTDLFDRTPPFSYGIYPYDPAVNDIRGRIVHVQAGIKW